MKHCTAFLVSLLALLVPAIAASAQSGSTDAGGLTLPVGQTSSILAVTLTFTTTTTPGTPFTINVLTQGSPNLDFNFAPGGTCSPTVTYAVGATCTVDYTFSPRFPGVRNGGISLTAGVTPLANTYLRGTGLGPQTALAPPTQITLGGGLSFPSSQFAIDGAGDIFVGYFTGAFQTGALVEIPSGCIDASCVVVLTYFSDFGGAVPNAEAMDGSGNLYIAFFDTSITGPAAGASVFEFPRGCFRYLCAKQLGGAVIEPSQIAVDQSGSGNVYVAAAYTGNNTSQNNRYVLEIPPGCASLSCVVPISEPFAFDVFPMSIDATGNLYFSGGAPASNPSSTGIYEIPAGCQSATCTVTFSGVGSGGTTAVDGADNLYVAQFNGYPYETITYEFPKGCMDVSCSLTVPPNTYQWYLPRGQLFNGNVYRINDGGYAVLEYDLTDPATVTFPTTVQGQTSPQQTVTLTNEGNQPLTLATSTTQLEPAISQYFQLDTTSTGTCGTLINASAMPTLASNAGCTFPLTFAPLAPALGTITGASTFIDNNLNVAKTTQTIPLVGTAVLPGTTYLSLTASLNPVFANLSDTLTAQLTSPSGTPTGAVTFSDGATVLATVPVDGSGVATTSVVFTAAGNHTLTATFAPTGIYLASNASLSQLVYPDGALAVLSATPNPASLGAPVSLSVTLTGSPAGPTPTGSVTFTVSGTALTPVPIVNGLATLSTTVLPGGIDSLSCNYSGDSNYVPDNCGTLLETINSGTTATVLTIVSSANPTAPFAPITFTATLTANGVPVSGVQVSLSIDGTLFSTKTTNAQGVVALPARSGLDTGQHLVTVAASAYGTYAASTASLTETVAALATPDFTLTLDPPTLAVATSSSGSVLVDFQSVAGFSGAVTLSCGQPLPPGIACAFDSTQLSVPANGAVSTSLRLRTTAIALYKAPSLGRDGRGNTADSISLATLLPLSLLGLFGLSRRRPSQALTPRLAGLGILLGLGIALGSLTGCGSGFVGSTPPGVYSLPILAVGSGSNATTHTVNLALTVTR